MIWRFRKHGKISEEEEEKIEKRAIRLVAYTFFILGTYVLYESVKMLYHVTGHYKMNTNGHEK